MNDQDMDLAPEEIAEEDEKPSRGKRRYLYNKIPLIGRASYFVFLVTVLLVPLFFLPASWGFQLEFVKKVLFTSGILLSLGLWLITKLEDGKIVLPGGAIFWSGSLLLVSFLASSLSSSNAAASLIGLGYENDTFAAFFLFFISMFLASVFFDSQKKTFQFFLGLIAVSSVAGVVGLLQIFSPIKLLSGGVLTNLIGKWNDLGIFFGLIMLVSAIGLELPSFRGSSMMKSVLRFLFAASFVFVAAVNYSLIWAVIGIFALVICVYSLAQGGMFNGKRHRSSDDDSGFKPSWSGKIRGMIFKPSSMIVIASIVFFIATNSISTFLGGYGLYQPEVRPSWQSTMEVAKTTMHKNFYFGSGPNTFSAEWSSNKPDAVNNTIFWNTEFNTGFGRVPSFAVTLGLFGLIASALFLFSLIYYVLKALLASFEDPSDQFVILVSSIASLYLWTFSVLYVTDTTLLVLTFVTTGVLLASMVRSGLIKQHGFSFLNSPKLGFLSVLIIVLAIISLIAASYLFCRKFTALNDFQRGIYSFANGGNITDVETLLKNSIGMDEQDLYYRSLAEVDLIKLRSLLNSPSGLAKDALFSQLKTNLSDAAGNARRATEINSSNYLNWITLGNVGVTVLPLKDVITGSYDLAITSYNKAISLNPKNPSIYLSLAQAEVAKGDLNKAKGYIGQALTMKNNYTEALFLASQIEAREGNLPNAIMRAEQAAVFSPGNVGILFQLGLLRYMNRNYSGAADALKAAIAVQPNYSNAKYFLGLSYSKLGQVANAIKEFQDIAAMNPDNKEVQNILRNLNAGRGALENIVPPKNEPVDPAKRSKLPVKEKTPVSADSADTVN